MQNTFSYEKAQQLIALLDLDLVIKRLIEVDGWKEQHVLAACQQYRRYLFLLYKYSPAYTLPPSRDIDEIWHAHILHTQAYTKFCEQLFGRFMHHHPHHGERGELSEDILQALFINTKKFYSQEFGEELLDVRQPNLLNMVGKWMSSR